MVLCHIAAQSAGRRVRLGLLDEAGAQIRYLVGPGPVKAHFPVGRHRVLALVAVVQRFRRTQNLLHLHTAAAQAGQGILHPLAFGPQLLGVVHMPEGTAAALAVVGAIRLPAVGRDGFPCHRLAEGCVFQHLHHQNVAHLACYGIVDEYHLAADTGDAQALAGVAQDFGSVNLIFHQR